MADMPAPTQFHELVRAARLLALGSLALLLAAFAWLIAGGATVWSYGLAAVFAVPIISGIGVSLHAIAWVRLRRASRGSPARVWAFRGSLLGFAAGLLTLPWFYWLLISPFIPMIPSVFAPVVVAHALLFILFARAFTNRSDTAIVVAGSAFLVAISVAGLAAQAIGPWALPLPFWGFRPSVILLFAGATALGYGIVAAGATRALAREEKSRAEVAALSPANTGAVEPIRKQDTAF